MNKFTNDGINVLSLFDGISAGQVALERAGIKVNNYYSSEIDKYAIQVTQKNYPNTIQLGDVFNIDYSKLPKIDLILAGFPCTSFSIANNNREISLDGEGGKLFMEVVRAIEILKPKWFLCENNHSIHQDVKDAVSRKLGVEFVMINSSLLSAQNRKRVYWTNISQVIKQPVDKKIFLKDILVKDSDSLKPITEVGDYVKNKYESFVEENGHVSELFNPYNSAELSDKAPTMTTQCGSMTASASVCVAMRGRYNEYGKTEQQLEPRKDDKTNTLTTVTKDNLIAEPIDPHIFQIGHGFNSGGLKATDGKTPTMTASCYQNNNFVIEPINKPDRIGEIGKGGQGERIYSVKGKSVNLTANGGGQGAKTGLYKIDLPDGEYIIRKLHIIECERLQTFSDFYVGGSGISANQGYKCLGNSWTVDVIVHILKHLFNPIEDTPLEDIFS